VTQSGAAARLIQSGCLRPRQLDVNMWTFGVLNERYATFYRGLKCLARALCAEVNFCLPKQIAGHLVWTRPWLLSASPPEAHVIGWIQRSLSPGGTLFDVGAHYGWMSIAAANCVGACGRVVAFEPSPVLLDILEYHKRVNRLRQLQIVPAAVSNIDDRAIPFYLINEGLSFRNSLTIGPDDTPYIDPENKLRINVSCTTLDSFVELSGIVPDLVKIDVEGAELLVLEGARHVLERHHPVLILGVHPYWLPRAHSVEQLFVMLEDLGYKIAAQHILHFDNSYLADYLFDTRSCILHEGNR
jgi:FkbM family methyltransferase